MLQSLNLVADINPSSSLGSQKPVIRSHNAPVQFSAFCCTGRAECERLSGTAATGFVRR